MTTQMRNLMEKLNMNDNPFCIIEEEPEYGIVTARLHNMMVREFAPAEIYEKPFFIVVDVCGNSYNGSYDYAMRWLDQRYTIR